MPIYFDKAKSRWRYMFNRVIARSRHRASRLLPSGWSRAQAETYERRETARLYAIATGIEQQDRLISEAVRLYIEHRLPILRDSHRAALHLAAILPHYEGRPLSALPDVARQYATDNATTLTAGTIRNRLAYLKAACRYAWKEHLICEHDPTSRMAIPAAKNERHVYLRLADVMRLARACDDRETAAIIRIAFYTGLRWVSELLPRQPEDLKRSARQTWLHIGTTKNGTPHMVPVHPAIRADLRRLPFRRHWRDYYAHFERARKKAGLQHVRMHDLRHSLASEIISRGGTLPDVQAALHHQSVASARRYAHLYPERVLKVMLGVGRKR